MTLLKGFKHDFKDHRNAGLRIFSVLFIVPEIFFVFYFISRSGEKFRTERRKIFNMLGIGHARVGSSVILTVDFITKPIVVNSNQSTGISCSHYIICCYMK